MENYPIIKKNKTIIKTRKLVLKFLTILTLILISLSFLLCSCEKKDSQIYQEEQDIKSIKISSLKGPTSVSIAHLMDSYNVNICNNVDLIVADIASNRCDIALLPANISYEIYKKNKNIKIIDINTLGVLYGLSQDHNIKEIKDLYKKTIYMTGKNTIPELLVNNLLDANNISKNDVNINFCSEASEVISHILQDPKSIGIVNEPQASVAISKNTNLGRVLDLTENGITGITVVNTSFLQNHKESVDNFINNHYESVKKTIEDLEETSKILVNKNVFENGDYLKDALKHTNICCIYGQEMKEKLQNFCDAMKIKATDDDIYYIK